MLRLATMARAAATRASARALASSALSPGTSFDDALYFTSTTSFNAWLAANHDSKTELFVGFWKKHAATAHESITWSEAVDEALFRHEASHVVLGGRRRERMGAGGGRQGDEAQPSGHGGGG